MAEEEIKETAAAAAEAPAAAEEVKIKKGKKRIDIQGIACYHRCSWQRGRLGLSG